MGKSKAPPPPDYAAAAVAQGAANVEATRLANRLNNPNINSPLGSRRIVYGSPTSPDDVTINETLSPAGQRLFDQENRLSAAYGDIGERGLDRLSQSFGSAFDASGLPRVSGVDNSAFGRFQPGQVSQYQPVQRMPNSVPYVDQYESTQNRRELNPNISSYQNAQGLPSLANSIDQYQANQNRRDLNPNISGYQSAQGLPGIDRNAVIQGDLQDVGIRQIEADTMSRDRVEKALFDRLQPRLDETRRQREEALIMQGQGRGGAAWNTQQRDLSQAETDAQIGAILGAGQEQQRLYDMAQSDSNRLYGQEIGLRGQQFGEQQSEYGRGFQESMDARGQLQNENLANAQARLASEQAQFGQGLAARQQIESENLNDFQARMAGQTTQFGQSLAQRGQLQNENLANSQNRLATEQAQFGQGLAERQQIQGENLADYQARVGGQTTQFGQLMDLRGQMQGENLSNYEAQLQGQNAQFNRALAANQQNQAGQQALYGIQSQNRSRALQEALALRQLPLQEINALRTGAQPTLPQFQSFQGQQIQAAPVFDAVNQQYQANLGQVNAKNAQKAATFKAIAGLGGAAFGGAGAAGGFGALFG